MYLTLVKIYIKHKDTTKLKQNLIITKNYKNQVNHLKKSTFIMLKKLTNSLILNKNILRKIGNRFSSHP